MTAPTVSIIVVAWNSAEELPDCLASVGRAEPDLASEVLVVDNGSVDASRDIAAAGGARVIALGDNRGFPAAVNAGLAEAAAPYVLLLNPDVRLGDRAISTCLAVLERDPSVGVVGANLRRSDGTPDPHAARRLRTVWLIALEALGITRLLGGRDPSYVAKARTSSCEVPCVNGAFMLLRTEVLRRLGGMDERVFMYLEDQALCQRVHASGQRVWFEAAAMATHIGAASTSRATSKARTTAYLHRLDADVTMAESRHGLPGRWAVVGLLLVRCVLGLVWAVVRSRDRVPRYRRAIAWLTGQLVSRRHPPPVALD